MKLQKTPPETSLDRIRKALGPCFFIGFKGLELPQHVGTFIEKNRIGGVTLFANNYESPRQVAKLIHQLQSLNIEHPLVIAVDQEGGLVQRFKTGFTRIPAARSIGDFGSEQVAQDWAELIAYELKAVGVNLVFSPVADINTNPKNPVIGTRAYGETEEVVTSMVSAAVRGFLKADLPCVVKHFPGHGDTFLDSHFHLPKVDTPMQTLKERELKPFLKAFEAGCECVMSTHIIVESLDPTTPSTLSSTVITDLLRKELHFKGLIFSDDMEMKAIADHFGAVDAALMAIRAGVNILLYHTEAFAFPVYEALVERLEQPEHEPLLLHLENSAYQLKKFKQDHYPDLSSLRTQYSSDAVHSTFDDPSYQQLANALKSLELK